MADFWLGECSARKLRVLIHGLPESSALHRARREGRTWDTAHVLLWQVVQQMARLEAVLGAQGVQKTPKFPPRKRTPWDDDSNVRRFGKVNDGDEISAVEYLLSISQGVRDGK